MSAPAKYQKIQSAVIDFDSVICSVESMDLLFESLLANSSPADRESTLRWAKEITDRGMSGEIPFSDSLTKRLDLLPKNPAPLAEVAQSLAAKLSASFLENLASWDISRIQVVSSGFRQLVQPALAAHDFPASQIHCNELIVDASGTILGVDKSNPLAGDDGKSAIVNSLKLNREIVMIGDGFTDSQVAASGAANYFFGYTEFVRREAALTNADEILSDFNRLSELVQLNRF